MNWLQSSNIDLVLAARNFKYSLQYRSWHIFKAAIGLVKLAVRGRWYHYINKLFEYLSKG